jgi:chromate transporter
MAISRALPSLGELCRIWAGIGLQSFGGGASTQLLIRRAFVDRSSWIDDEEFTRFWILCQFAPGINLLALTVLIGRKLGGYRGIVVSLAGLLVPSAGITCALTAGYAAVQGNPAMHAVVRGVIPATAGIMAVVALGFARPLIRRAQREGMRALCLSGALVLAGAAALIRFQVPTLVVLAGMAVLGAILFTPRGQGAAVK